MGVFVGNDPPGWKVVCCGCCGCGCCCCCCCCCCCMIEVLRTFPCAGGCTCACGREPCTRVLTWGCSGIEGWVFTVKSFNAVVKVPTASPCPCAGTSPCPSTCPGTVVLMLLLLLLLLLLVVRRVCTMAISLLDIIVLFFNKLVVGRKLVTGDHVNVSRSNSCKSPNAPPVEPPKINMELFINTAT